jgi:hypothetical protein
MYLWGFRKSIQIVSEKKESGSVEADRWIFCPGWLERG